MPLERRCVRFIDNFSGGTRGALSAEHFLQVRSEPVGTVLCPEAAPLSSRESCWGPGSQIGCPLLQIWARNCAGGLCSHLPKPQALHPALYKGPAERADPGLPDAGPQRPCLVFPLPSLGPWSLSGDVLCISAPSFWRSDCLTQATSHCQWQPSCTKAPVSQRQGP